MITVKVQKTALRNLKDKHPALYESLRPGIRWIGNRPYARVDAEIFHQALEEFEPPEEVRSNLLEQAAHFTRAKITEAVRPNPYVPQEVLMDRKAICEQCEYMNEKKTKCTLCGCFYNKKISLKAEQCPMGFWEVYLDDPTPDDS